MSADSTPVPSQPPKLKTFRESIGEAGAQDLHAKLDAALDSRGQAFVVIVNGEEQRMTDAYHQVCDRCVQELEFIGIQNATQQGMLMPEVVARMHGHKHQRREPPPQRPNERPELEL